MVHEYFMKRALDLADHGKGSVSPNPMVGAVVVKDNVIVGEGYHEKAGEPHAEVLALKEAQSAAVNGSMYVTLEPCTHFGRTPPCTEVIIESGIKKIFIACLDPYERVKGEGVKRLKEAGIEVVYGILEAQALKLNEIFNKYITTGLPFVSLKFAATWDGKTATYSGDSKWISNYKSRQFVHRLRHKYDAVLVGAETVQMDNPSLTTRDVPFEGINPIRIILDGKLQSSLQAKVYTDKEAPTLLVTSKSHDSKRLNQYKKMDHVELLTFSDADKTIDIYELLKKLGEMEISSILIEGGSKTASGFLDVGAIDKLYLFASPKILGGNAVNMFEGKNVSLLSNALQLHEIERVFFDEDTLFIGRTKYED